MQLRAKDTWFTPKKDRQDMKPNIASLFSCSTPQVTTVLLELTYVTCISGVPGIVL